MSFLANTNIKCFSPFHVLAPIGFFRALIDTLLAPSGGLSLSRAGSAGISAKEHIIICCNIASL